MRLTENGRRPDYSAILGQSLSQREADVMRLAAQGKTNKEIGASLFVAENTIKSHIGRINKKFGSRDRTHAVVLAIQQGYIPLAGVPVPCPVPLTCSLPAGHNGAHHAGGQA